MVYLQCQIKLLKKKQISQAKTPISGMITLRNNIDVYVNTSVETTIKENKSDESAVLRNNT